MNKKIKSVISLLVAVLLVVSLALVACKDKTQYTVTFETNGGSAVKSLSLREGDAITRPQDPKKDFFVFDKWYSDKALTKAFNFDTETMPAKNITLYAGWIPGESVMVRFDANGGTFGNNETVLSVIYKKGDKASAPTEQPSYVGYEFGGWCVDQEGKQEFNFASPVNDSVTLYARWNDSSAYAYVRYYGNGRLLDRVAVRKGEALSEASVDLSAYVVDGWYTQPQMQQKYAFGAQINENLDLYSAYYTEGLVIEGGKVVHYNGTDSDIVVPHVYEGQPVTTIGEHAFYRSSQVASPVRTVLLPESITTLCDGAFYGCEYLTEVNLTANVTVMGAYAFHGDIRLKNFGNISGLTEIPEGAFLGCESLQSISIPASVTTIGASAFADCKGLTSVTVPKSITYISDNIFDGCVNLLTAEFATEQPITFGKEIFRGCDKLQTITIKSKFCAEFDSINAQKYYESPFIDCNNARILVLSGVLESYIRRYNNLDGGDFISRLQMMN